MKNGFIKVAAVTPALRVADCSYNANEIISITNELTEKGTSLIVFPELSLTGYSCGDLFLTRTLPNKALSALKKVLDETSKSEAVIIVGLPYLFGGKLYNCAAVCQSGSVLALVPKTTVADHGAYSESRWFTAAPEENHMTDIFDDLAHFGASFVFRSETQPDFAFAVEIGDNSSDTEYFAHNEATIICNPCASEELVGRADYRRTAAKYRSAKYICGCIYSSSREDESTTDLVYSGHSIISENGRILLERIPFSEKSDKYRITEIDVEMLSALRKKTSTFTFDDDCSSIWFYQEPTETKLTRKIDAHPFLPDDPSEQYSRAKTILDIQANGLAKRLCAAYAKTAVMGISGGLDSTLALIAACRAMDILGRSRTDIIGVTMPCFGTTKRTKGNAQKLCEALGVTFKTVNIAKSVRQHFADIGHDENNHNVVFENAQARERTQVIMDIANATNGLVVGTGDLSEVALGWATYNGDHMSMYCVNSDIPKTLVRHVVRCYADTVNDKKLASVLYDILDTPVSPELLPANKDGTIAQVTESIVGPYELHDFFIYNFVRYGFSPTKLLCLAENAFEGLYTREVMIHWLRVFFKRFFSQQFKRSCTPDAPKVGTVALSPRGDWKMPSDACVNEWLSEIDEL